MAGFSDNSSGGTISGINVTPLVDITLVLLIIFIVTAKLVVTPAVPLDLPEAKSSEEIQMVFSVILPAQGPILVNGAAVSEDDGALERLAKAALKADPEVRAVISADGSVPHRSVVKVLGALRDSGISRIAFAATPEGEGATP